MNRQPPAIGTVEGGYRFKGGDPAQETSWEQVAPVDVSGEWGAGARQLPNGTIERVGPRGGVTQIGSAGDGDSIGKLTEGQGKALLFGNMMAGAERDYQQARRDGYNPASLRNQVASAAGVIPFDGDFFGRLIRDDVSDRGRQAELRWAEGNLRQLTGAAATNPEIARVAAINFDRGNDELAEQRYQTRAETFQGTKYSAGPGASVLGDYPEMRGLVGTDTENGLPSYPGIAAMTQGATELPIPEGGYGGPRPGDVRVTQQALAAEDTPESLRAQGYVYDPERDTWSRTRQEQAPMSAEQAVEDRRGLNGFARRADAVARGAADMLSFGFADEAAAIGDSIIPLSRGSRSLWSDGFEDAFAHNLAMQRGGDAADRTDVPVSRMAGQGLGVGLGVGAALSKTGAKLASGLPSFLRAEAKPTGATRAIPEIMRRGRNAARAGLFGGGGAALAASGENEGNIPERLAAGARAAPLGAILGTAAGPAVEAIARPVGLFGRRVMNRVSSLDDLLRRMSIPADAAEQAALMRSQGLSPTITDLADDAGRGQLRALATRQTPARQAARDFSEGRANDLQDRLSVQAQRNISNDPRTPREIKEEAMDRARERAAPLYEEAYARPGAPRSGLTDELMRRPSMREAARRAYRIAAEEGRDPTTLGFDFDAAGDVIHVREPSMQTMDYIKRGLDDVLEGYRDPVTGRMNLDTAGRAAENTRASFRRELRRLNPVYGRALDTYGEDAAFQRAVDLGERFMTMEADDFARAMHTLTPDQLAVARAAARRAIERAGGTQGAAPGVARRLSGGREQQARNAALLDDPQNFQQAVGMEHQAVQNAGAINPMRGSPTAPSMQDAMKMAGEAIGTAQDVVGGNVPGLMSRVASGFKTMGFNDQEAEMVVMAAIDPAQTDRILQILAQSVGPERAQRAVMAAKYAMIQNTGEGVGSQGQYMR